MRLFGKSLRAFILALLCLFGGARSSFAQQPTFTPFKTSGIYAVGENVGWTVTASKAGSPDVSYTYTIKKNNLDEIKSGKLEFTGGSTTIETVGTEPEMIYVQITSGEKKIALGAAVDPEKLQPSVPAPSDFDEFWNSKIKMLEAIPPHPQLVPGNSGKPSLDYATITMDNINGGHIHGQIAKPRREGKFPGLVLFQWAGGPYPLEKNWVTDRASEGWLTLDIEPHDVLPDQPRSYYDALPASLKNYQTIGHNNRDKCYFLQMYLADYRAVEYLASRDDWDGRTLIVSGTSMGGQQSLCVAGLNPKITGVIVNEPSGCDSNGPLHGRASGYPSWPSNDPKVMETALYFDAVNFAPRIKAPTLVAMGFIDTTSPPVGLWTAFNQIPGAKEAAPMIDSDHNNRATPAQQRPFTVRSGEWFKKFAKGETIK